jgi:RNA polymerase subunit RPABC4/transcription elongation factor Spt4
MTCSRCGAEAVVKRDAAFYCGKCAMARDWEEIIAIVQNDSAQGATIDFSASSDPAMSPAPAPVPAAAPAPSPPSAAQDQAVLPEPAPAAANSGNGDIDLPADPFG